VQGSGIAITRRTFLRALAAGAAVLALPLRLPLRVRAATRPRFFTRAERRTLEALCDRILPPDRDPGAKRLGAARYVESLLGAFDGDPPFLYAGGPFSGRTPYPNRRGRRSDRSPPNAFRRPVRPTRLQELAWRAELFGSEAAGLPAALAAQRGGPFEGLRDVYRQGLAAVDALARERGAAPFHALSHAEQDNLLEQLDGPEAILFPGRGESFLDVLIRHVLEGCFSAPEYGGNRERRGWRMIGIEGDVQPLGYSVYAEATGAYRERRRHPMSTPDRDDLRRGALAPRPLSPDAIAIQDAIADFAAFLESTVPGACA
jgi:Gluconate 2-dehydrogenase subunit 3